tara:strand:+ start:8360 stop:8836 length:477 start_codon:yes stop_codon:yes gene_type:complete
MDLMSVRVLETHEALEECWTTSGRLFKASEKGYPPLFDDMQYWVLFLGEYPVAYTGSKNMGQWIFVGNTYVRKKYRGNGLHSRLIQSRNKRLPNLPKITILNPIRGSLTPLVSVVSSLGYTRIAKYEDLAAGLKKSPLPQEIYDILCANPNQQIWRLD